MRGYDLAHTPRRRIAMVAACPFPAPRGSQVLIRDLAHALVCPRSSWSGFPIKLINYMATGRAIVAADGSAKGIVHGETGLTFRNGSAAGMAAALLRLYDDPALRQRLGENARVAARARYSWRRAALQVEAIYSEVCGMPADSAAALPPPSRLQIRPMSRAVGAGPQR